MAAQPLPRITPEEYLQMERDAEFRSEYYHGHVYPMSAGSYQHGLIIVNAGGELRSVLRGGPCRVVADVRLRTSEDGLYTYPDLMVVCGVPKFVDRMDTIVNPTLLLEVLSPSTESRDRGFKFAQYRKLESLREYAMISQAEPHIEKYLRQSSGEWLLSEVSGLAGVCAFESVGCKIALVDIYRDVTFGEAAEAVTS